MNNRSFFYAKHSLALWLLFTCFAIICAIFTAANISHAMSNEQRQIINYSISHYNICSTDGSSSNGSISSAIANANDNAEAIFNVLTTTNFTHNGNKPLNAVQAAAILGNLQSESDFDPMSGVNTGYYKGIAQWGGSRWEAIAEPKTDLANQVAHLISELDGDYYGPALQEFWESKDEGDLAKATFAFTRNYEVAILHGGGSTKWSDHDTARYTVQAWDEQASMGQDNPRWPNAQAQYNLYKDKVPSANSTPTRKEGRFIWVGDSRTEGMRDAISNGDNVWVAKSSTGYDWFNSEAAAKVTESLGDEDKAKDTTIVFNFGVNDLNNADNYITKLNQLIGGDWKNAEEVIVMSVNPVIDGKNAASNAAIEEFNNKLKNGLSNKITYKDTYTDLKSELQESDFDEQGLHYTEAIYKKLYNMIRNDGSDQSESTVCNENGSGGGATKYASDGAIVYEQCDEQWANSSFGSSTVCPSGCGPSAMAMIITALTGKSVTPDMTAKVGSSSYVPGAGSSHDLPENIDDHFGVKAEKIENSVSSINEVLNKGGMVWMCGAGPNPFTSGGHCVAVRARNSEGKWLFFDSAGGRDPNAAYDPNNIVANAGGVTAVYKK
ncbi:MAG: phage tail tip lysozyme [Candidatus Saccharibacteria bacterium]|nr:phage tail tip lysozyme [Candidatus Saccharibacteria bacterium]